MKILFITNIPSPTRKDFFYEMSKSCDLTVLYELPRSRERNQEWRSEQENTSGYREIYLKPVWRKAATAWCPSFVKYLKNDRWDMVIVGGYSTPTGMHAIHYLKRRKMPYAVNCDGGFVPLTENPLKYRLKKYFLSGAELYFCTGESSESYLKHYGAYPGAIKRYPFSPLHEKDILHEPAEEGEKERLKAELGWEENKIILSVGSFIRRKGFDILLKAAADFREQYGIYIIGGGVTEQYRQLIEEYKLDHVHFLPFMKSRELRKCYRASDVFALPTREDIWGLVINEAMAVGLPVITTDRCAAGIELVDQEYIVPVEDAKALSNRIKLFMENAELRWQVGCRNLEKIREYTIENMAEAHIDILREREKNRQLLQ